MFKKIIKSPLTGIFLAALFLRIALAPFLYHSDIKVIYFISHFLTEGIFNIYSYLTNNPLEARFGQFVYPPLTYYLFGIFYSFINILAGHDFNQWLGMGNELSDLLPPFRYLFLMKLPLFFFEFLIGYLLTKIIKGEKQKKMALLLWFFNPVNIYVMVAMGQFDIVPTFLSVLSVYLALTGRWGWAAFILGIGGAIKAYPLLFLPFLVLASRKKIIEQLKILLVGLFPYLAGILPFMTTQSFKESVLLSGLSQRLFFLHLPIGFEERILVVLFGLTVLLLSLVHKQSGARDLIGYFAAVVILILGGSHFHPQWFIWALPFLIILLVENKNLLFSFTLLIISWLGVTFMFDDKFLTLGFLSAVDPGVLFLPTVREMTGRFMSPDLVQSVFHTIFFASAVWFIYLVIFKKEYGGK